MMSWVNQDDDWVTMNYGYAMNPDDPKSDGVLLSDMSEEQDRREIYSIQLYYYTASVLPGVKNLEGKTLVEMGSGRGGGLSFLTRFLNPEKAIGIDFSQNQVDFCNKRHSDVTNLTYYQGNAETFTELEAIEEGSVDLLVNVESSHCYGNIDNFFTQINRALSKDGYFCFTDFRGKEGMETLKAKLAEYFTIVNQEDISMNVKRALKLDTDR